MYFRDRSEAGQILAEKLIKYRDDPDGAVLALPRGGVPVAFEVAKAVALPLDVFLVRKLGVPGREELAMGAVADGGTTVLSDDVIGSLNIPPAIVDEAVRSERRIIERKREVYRGDHLAPEIEGRSIILVDDGLATGSTMRAAVAALHKRRPKRLVVAVPVGAEDTCVEFGDQVDEVVCAIRPRHLMAVGLWYDDFSPTSDSMVRILLAQASQYQRSKAGGARWKPARGTERNVPEPTAN